MVIIFAAIMLAQTPEVQAHSLLFMTERSQTTGCLECTAFQFMNFDETYFNIALFSLLNDKKD